MPTAVLDVLLAAGLILAVAVDVRSRRVPNAVTLPVALLALGVRAAALGWAGLSDGVGGVIVGMGLLLPVWLAGGTGAGDVKLLGMVGAAGGVRFALWTALFGAVAGGLMALALLALRGGGREVLRNVGTQVHRAVVLQLPAVVQPTPRSFRMSYAAAIAVGALAAAFYL